MIRAGARTFAAIAGWAALVLAGAVAALGATAAWWWPGELVVHWTLHAGVALLLLWGLRLGPTRRRPAALAALALGLAGIAPWLLAAARPRAPLPDAGGAITVASANLYAFNAERRSEALAAIDAQRPDLAVVIEAIPGDRAAMEARFPHVVASPGRRHGGNIIAARWPLRAVWTDRDLWGALLEAQVDAPRPFRVIAVHPMTPTSPAYALHRQRMYDAVAARMRAVPGPCLVLGDFNCTRASPAWRDLLRDGGLREPAGWSPATWPSHLGIAGIGIDHILGRDLASTPVRAFRLPGSDHHGVVAGILPPPPAVH